METASKTAGETVRTFAGRVGRAGGPLVWLAGWSARHYRWLAVWVAVAWVAYLGDAPGVMASAVVVGGGPGVLACAWATRWPTSYERLVAGPARRMGWRRRIWFGWKQVCEDCGLTERKQTTKRGRDGKTETVVKVIAPRLRWLRARGHSVTLTIEARPGQTVDELEERAAKVAATFRAITYRCWADTSRAAVLMVELVMHDVLTTATTATAPEVPRAVVDWVHLGRTQAGKPWRLMVRGWHTLIVGATGAGKGSVLWGICCGLAPAVRVDMVRLWGIDLKRGVELAMGEGLFSARAYKPADAVRVLKALMKVIDERGARMAGQTRLHVPTVGDPLHVLVIDELAALTAYADPEIRREAAALLSEILTQGRALGVVVIACVQDPRKQVVDMRGLFSQCIALRLRTADETDCVLDGFAKVAPAHRIAPSMPGTAWLVEDNGAVDRVRADFWPDDLIRVMASRYATEEHVTLPEAPAKTSGVERLLGGVDFEKADRPAGHPELPVPPPRAPNRKPRKPRTPRQPRPSEDAGVSS